MNECVDGGREKKNIKKRKKWKETKEVKQERREGVMDVLISEK